MTPEVTVVEQGPDELGTRLREPPPLPSPTSGGGCRKTFLNSGLALRPPCPHSWGRGRGWGLAYPTHRAAALVPRRKSSDGFSRAPAHACDHQPRPPRGAPAQTHSSRGLALALGWALAAGDRVIVWLASRQSAHVCSAPVRLFARATHSPVTTAPGTLYGRQVGGVKPSGQRVLASQRTPVRFAPVRFAPVRFA